MREIQELNGEDFCRLERKSETDIMTVVCETHGRNHSSELTNRILQILKQKLGVALEVEITGIGSTADYTQINARQKPIRLIDLRK